MFSPAVTEVPGQGGTQGEGEVWGGICKSWTGKRGGREDYDGNVK